MSLAGCAEIVRKGDPDRFLAAMATSTAVRAALFPVYAFNVEIARAVSLVREPMTARIRLQWWRDSLEEIAGGGESGNHEVTTALARVVDARSLTLLDALVAARSWDIDRTAFESEDQLSEYLGQTAGNLAVAAARAIGVTDSEDAIRRIAWASGLANLFLGIPRLTSMGHDPLFDSSPGTVRRLAARGLSRIAHARPTREAKPALLATWRAGRILRRAKSDPKRVMTGGLGGSEFVRRASLLWHVVVE